MIYLIKFWREALIIFLIITFSFFCFILEKELSSVTEQLEKSKAENVLNELQKDTLRSAILAQNDAVEKQRIDAVQRAEVLRVKSNTIQAKYERELAHVSNLKGTAECDAMRKIIKGAVQ
jgi:hypothetical protein